MDKNRKYSITTEKDENTNTMSVIVEGELSLRYISEIREDIKSAIRDAKNLKMIISNADMIDLSFLQLVISLQNTYRNRKDLFSIEFEIDQEKRDLLINSGFKELLKI
ncbi:MAG: hypothetical protein J7K53_13565 [Bacteroidales bacterium]|nr:hypothetical protein [Bacteroidales bacterium]